MNDGIVSMMNKKRFHIISNLFRDILFERDQPTDWQTDEQSLLLRCYGKPKKKEIWTRTGWSKKAPLGPWSPWRRTSSFLEEWQGLFYAIISIFVCVCVRACVRVCVCARVRVRVCVCSVLVTK